jgi:hypothetical protein
MSNFYLNVIARHPLFDSPNRIATLDLLEPITRQAVVNIIADAEQAGVKLQLTETYRSQRRQEMLFTQGATQLRKVGVHHYGLAADFVRIDAGHADWAAGDYAILGMLAVRHGLIWGGSWTGFVDRDHVQRIMVDDQAKLFAGTWYPDADYSAAPHSTTGGTIA